MAETTSITKKLFGNPEGSNKKQKEIARLRSVALDEGESATERLVAAHKLLSRFRLSRDNARIIRATIKAFINDPNADVQIRAAKLKRKFLSAKELKAIEKMDLPDESEIVSTIADEPPTTIVAGTSASEVPPRPPALNRDEIEKLIRGVIGVGRYDGILDVAALSISKQNLVVERIVNDLARLSLSQPEIESVIGTLEREGLDSHFPNLIAVARRYLAETIDLLERANRRDF